MNKKRMKLERDCHHCEYGSHGFWASQCNHKPLTKQKEFFKILPDSEENSMTDMTACEFFKWASYYSDDLFEKVDNTN